MLLKKVLGTNLSFPLKLMSQVRYKFAHKLVETVESDKQELFLDSENCILVNENDVPIGQSSKRDCHKLDDQQNIKLHRAFSVFLFNKKGEMLMQKRSSHKIVFPNFFSNACCSHPLYDLEDERDELNAIGIKKAAQRRLNFELGIPMSQVRPEYFHYLTRVHYLDKGDGRPYGEHEIDYILFFKGDVNIKPNPEEISEICWINLDNMDEQISSLTGSLTPWFRWIHESRRLCLWWKNLHRLKKFEDHKTIHKLN